MKLDFRKLQNRCINKRELSTSLVTFQVTYKVKTLGFHIVLYDENAVMSWTYEGVVLSHSLRNVQHELPQLNLAATLQVCRKSQIHERHGRQKEEFVLIETMS